MSDDKKAPGNVKKLPMLLVLQRKSIRLYPKNITVGLYYSKDLDQYFAISSEDQSINISEKQGMDYKIYHKSFTSACDEVLDRVDGAGYHIDEDEWWNSVSSGPKKPSNGKTNSYSISLMQNGKPSKKKVHFQVYGMENGYELNMYIS